MQSNDPAEILSAIRIIRYYVDRPTPTKTSSILQVNALSGINKCLSMQAYPEILYEALWALVNISLITSMLFLHLFRF